MRDKLLKLAALTLIVSSNHCLAAKVENIGQNQDGIPLVLISGDLVEGDVARFADVTDGLENALVLFESNGGNLQSGLDIGSRIRMRGYSTVVADGKECYSACALAWLGGTTRYAGIESHVSFHAAYILEDGMAQESGVANALVGAYASKLGLENDAVIFLTSAPPERLNELNQALSDSVKISVVFGTTRKLETVRQATVSKEFQTFTPEEISKLIKEAENGMAQAQFNLGLLYYSGYGVKKDVREAVELYILSANQGYAKAQAQLGYNYLFGWEVEKDLSKAFDLLTKSANQNDSVAQKFLGYMYLRGLGVEKNAVTAFNLYQRSAEQGYARAQVALGRLYLNGIGTEVDDEEAAGWIQLAADQGEAEAQDLLADLYFSGRGVVEDYPTGFQWRLLAAQQGNPVYQYELAKCYLNGWGVGVDEVEAAKWFLLSANQGNSDAQFSLARSFENAHGLPVDYAAAFSWMKKAAENGNVDAQFQLGVYYYEGVGVQADQVLETKWISEAAINGHSDALFFLALNFADGRGVAQSGSNAAKYIIKFLESDDEDKMSYFKLPMYLDKSTVIYLQTTLSQSGFYKQKVDGSFGPATVEAIRAYAEAHEKKPSSPKQ